MDEVGSSIFRNKAFEQKSSKERLLKNLIVKDAPIILDVGAHYGQSISLFKKVFPESIIHSFEPDPISYEKLKCHTMGMKGIHLNNCCVLDHLGKVEFYQNAKSHTNSIFRVNSKSKDSLDLHSKISKIDVSVINNFPIKVNAVTLDEYVRKNSITHIDLLKIDTQASEVQVLAGAQACLSITDLILIEISFFDYYEKSTSFYDIENILRKFSL